MKCENSWQGFVPFLMYWFACIALCVMFFWKPEFIIYILVVGIIWLLIWAVIVYLVGNAAQKRACLKKVWQRFVAALVCSLLVVLIYPVCDVVYEYWRWGHFNISWLVSDLTDPIILGVFGVHTLLLWLGEETARLGAGEE